MEIKIPSPVAVTGGRGMLGATILRTFPGATSLTSDIREGAMLLEEVGRIKPSVIIHTAAKTAVAECEKNPKKARAVNVGGTENVVKAARAVNARVIYISTVSVFDGRTGDYRESDTPQPVNVYNITKRDGELAVLEYEQGMVIRLNLVGVHPEGSRGKNFMEWLLNSATANKDLTLFNDQFINPLSNWTVATLIKTIIEKDIQEKILHIGSSNRLSKAAIGKLVLKRRPDYHGTVTEKSVESIADGVVRPKEMWLNTARASVLFGPLPTIEQELDTVFLKTPFTQEV